MKYFVSLILVFLSTFAIAQEQIISYDVDITIANEDRITVVEKIKVRAEGVFIRRGIYRTLPILRPNKNNKNEPAPVNILSLTRDGKKEKYKTEKSSQEITVYFGSEDVILNPGIYEYEFTYETQNQISFFDDYDELYWNIVGHHWSFPVLAYSATIHMPEGGEYIQGACYSGAYGANASDCTLSVSQDKKTVTVNSTAQLYAQQGATIAVAWTKGVVENNFSTKLNKNGANIILFIISLFIFLVLAYYWWQKVGVDPPTKPVVPSWTPPQDMSPAEINYIRYRNVSNTTVSSALVNAAVKGALKIESTKKKFTFTKTGEFDTLTTEEKALLNGLFKSGDTYTLSETNYTTYQSALSSFTFGLKGKIHLEEYFKTNIKYISWGILLLSATLAFALSYGKVTLVMGSIGAYFVTFFVLVAGFIIVSLPFFITNWYKVIVVPFFLVLVSGFMLLFIWLFYYIGNPILYAVLLAIASFCVGLYVYLITAPTEKGQVITAEIDGFKMYLEKTEKDLLNFMTPPEKTPELFEKLLPYAMALKVENKWAGKFKDVLAKAIADGTYHPVWYAGNIAHLSNMSRTFSSAVTSAAPKSSSGSGGGGFSGGGGGGGGGGGW